MEVGPERGDPAGLVLVEPAIDGIRIPGPEQPGPGHGMRTHAIGDLQQGGRPLPQLGMRIVIPAGEQRLPGVLGQIQASASNHGKPPGRWFPSLPLPISAVKNDQLADSH